jgi:cellulose synthase/poly-beta-1,6-N-acetylglucosamine synthase-like glycosyltransferase
VHAMLALRYPVFEVLVIDDGSTDGTFARLDAEFDLVEVPRVIPRGVPTRGAVHSVHVPRLRPEPLVVVRKENGGKTDALNVGINLAQHPLVCMVDADSVLDPQALLSVAKPFADDPLRVAAAGGVVRIANGCTVLAGRIVDTRMPRGWLPRIQVVEYLRAFLFGRLGWNRLGGNLIISGAFGLFRKDHLLAVGGYDATSIVEDLDLVVRLHRYLRSHKIRYEIPFIPDPVAWTEVPESLRVLSRQRGRWQRGLVAAMWQYRGMLFNPRYGRVGLIAVPFYTLGEMLAPLVEVFGYVIIVAGLVAGVVNVSFALLFILVAWGYGMLLSLWAVVLEEVSFHRYRRLGDLVRLVLFATLENFGYHQCGVWWRLRAFFTRRGRKHVWGEMTRRGFETATK